MALYRLDKIISASTSLSRKEVKRLVKSGKIIVDGRPAAAADAKYDPECVCITVNGEAVSFQEKHYFMMNKPAGVVSSTADEKEKTVLELLSGKEAALSLFPAGRLDKDAEGLLLLTDDGAFCHDVISPGKKVAKRYYVEVDQALTEEDARAFQAGVELNDFQCMPAQLDIIEEGKKNRARVTICEGKYHQVKRMFGARGKQVLYLKRTAIGKLELDKALLPGEYRPLTDSEIKSIFIQNM